MTRATQERNNEIDWARIRRIPINDPYPTLDILRPAPFWHIVPVYAQRKLPGACTDCYLRPEVIAFLQLAAKAISDAGLQLTILDAWRPPQVQTALYHELFESIQAQHPDESEQEWHRLTQKFVALPSESPTHPSPHLTGGSVDVTLSDKTGKMLDMGGHFDEPSSRSFADAYDNTPGDIQTRRRLLQETMLRAGFTHLPTEWWHFDYGNQVWAYYSGEARAKFGLVYPNRDMSNDALSI